MASTHRKFIAIYVSAYTTAYCTCRYALTREKVGIRGGVNDRSISHPFRHLFQTSTSGRPRSIPDTEFIGEFSNKMVPKRHNPASQSVETLTKETFKNINELSVYLAVCTTNRKRSIRIRCGIR